VRVPAVSLPTTTCSTDRCNFWFERLREDIDLLGATVHSLAAARTERAPEETRAVLYARLEVTAIAVVDEFVRLWGQPAGGVDARSKQDPAEEGGLLVQ
jgi:hypothetical protein